MPTLDRIYRLFPGGASGVFADVWVTPTLSGALATVGEQVDDGGIIYAPLSTVTIRTRYRTDVSQRSRWRDETGRVWRTNEIAEVGRRQWLDVSLSTYDIPAPVEDGDPSFVPPTGWLLQHRRPGGADHNAIYDPPRFVDRLIVVSSENRQRTGELHGHTFARNYTVFDVRIPRNGYAVAPGVTQWMTGIIPATLAGDATWTRGFHLSTTPDRALINNAPGQVAITNLDGGRLLPTPDGAVFEALPQEDFQSGAVRAILPGVTIRITAGSGG